MIINEGDLRWDLLMHHRDLLEESIISSRKHLAHTMYRALMTRARVSPLPTRSAYAIITATNNNNTRACWKIAGPYGGLELKNLAKQIKRDMKEQIKSHRMRRPAESLLKVAKEKATNTLLRRKEQEARIAAKKDFRERNPVVKI